MLLTEGHVPGTTLRNPIASTPEDFAGTSRVGLPPDSRKLIAGIPGKNVTDTPEKTLPEP